jgi:hypothetical protein
MPEALWVQGSGIDYSAAEDRRLISAIGTAGVLGNGLLLTGVSGPQVSISAGKAIVDDGGGGSYLAYFDGTTTKAIPSSGTTNVYVAVDPVTALATIETGAEPVNPHISIGSATASGIGVPTVSNARASSQSAAQGTNVLSKFPTSDVTTTETTGGRYVWAGAHDFQSTVRAEGGIAYGASGSALLPGGVSIIIPTTAPVTVSHTAVTPRTVNWSGGTATTHGNATGLTNGTSQLMAPTAGLYAYSAHIRWDAESANNCTLWIWVAQSTGTSDIGVDGADTQYIMAAQARHTDGDGLNGTSMSMNWIGWKTASSLPIQTFVLHDDDVDLHLTKVEIHWHRIMTF